MNPSRLLANLMQRDVVITAAGDRLRLDAPQGMLTPEVRAAVTEHKPEILRLLARAADYRATLRAGYALIAAGSDAAAEACVHFLAEQQRFADELGPALAAAIRRGEGRRWWKETGRCPLCGELGVFHEPEAAP